MAIGLTGVDRLQKLHRGALITASDPRYDESRRVWNAMIDKRPAIVARCRGAADVVAAVNFARDSNLTLAVRGGGHNIAGRSTCDDGLVIDFADMKSIRVDPIRGVARAEPGLRWTEFDAETQAFGLATTGGTVGDTGIAGLTLGGGFGWLEGRCGMTIDNLLSADVVLADGRLVHASADENDDLYWALRGGGGNFGVVTSFEYRLHEVGPTIVGGLAVHPFSDAVRVLKFYRDFLKSAPDALTVAAVLLTGPDGQKGCGLLGAYAGSVADGEKAIQPVKTFGSPVVNALGPLPYLAQQSLIDAAMPPHLLNYWKAEFVRELSDELIETAVDAYSRAVSPLSSILFFPIHGAASKVSPDATAYPHRTGLHLGIYALWHERADNDANIAWVRQTWQSIQPHVPGGVYVNELGDDEGDERIRQAYGGNYPRLAKIKTRYDPENLFRLNANIRPA